MGEQNLNQEIIQPETTVNFPIKRKKTWLIFTLITLIVIIFGVIGVLAYQNHLLKNQIQSKKDISTTNITPTPYLTATPTKIPDINVSIGNLEWLKYEPNCNNLKNNIIIYYLKGWLPKEFAFVFDNENPGTRYECQALFGYGAQPQSPQSYSSGELARIVVKTWVDTETATVQEYKNLMQEQYSTINITLSEQTINNQDYIKMSYNDGENYEYTTKKGDRFFSIIFSLNPSENTNSINSMALNVINQNFHQEFIKKLQIL